MLRRCLKYRRREVGNMFCDNCGKELTKTSGFCPQCGNAIKQEKSNETTRLILKLS